ncbi:MAG: DUF3878 family protein [Lachnospiraceae bacterium]
MNTFLMLQELIAQNEFELLLPKEKEKNKMQDLKLVYQMNDTVESFLIFREAIWTGNYKEEYKGKLKADFHEDGDRSVLTVRQGDSVLTLFYRKLDFEVHLYNYGDACHFWVPRYENLRQLEFRIAVLWDKYTYLGEAYCTEGEKQLVHLADVPALNFCSYCAYPKKYMVPHEMPKESFLQGLDVMEQLAVQAKDRSLVRWIRVYRKHPNRLVTKWMAHLLHRSAHFEFVKLLTETIKKETAVYPHRSFGKEQDDRFDMRIQVARQKCQELERAGAYAEVLREEPFTIGKEQMERKVYVMATWKGRFSQSVEILEY